MPTRPYCMAEQRCLMCSAPVPFVPFKDPLCDPPCWDTPAALEGDRRTEEAEAATDIDWR